MNFVLSLVRLRSVCLLKNRENRGSFETCVGVKLWLSYFFVEEQNAILQSVAIRPSNSWHWVGSREVQPQ